MLDHSLASVFVVQGNGARCAIRYGFEDYSQHQSRLRGEVILPFLLRLCSFDFSDLVEGGLRSPQKRLHRNLFPVSRILAIHGKRPCRPQVGATLACLQIVG